MSILSLVRMKLAYTLFYKVYGACRYEFSISYSLYHQSHSIFSTYSSIFEPIRCLTRSPRPPAIFKMASLRGDEPRMSTWSALKVVSMRTLGGKERECAGSRG